MNDASLSRPYNLGRLGQTGDEVILDADADERAAVAKAAELLEVPKFSARITLKKLSPTRFALHYDLAAEIVQACVVTLEPVAARITKDFVRELHHTPNINRAQLKEVLEKEVIVSPNDDDLPDEIESLHYDLAEPLLEEFLLAIDPYPRAPGVAFAPPEGMGDKPESPFAVLKALKSGD
jgi:uncharacterized metal-binding protein YceD (DUF177 family)